MADNSIDGRIRKCAHHLRSDLGSDRVVCDEEILNLFSTDFSEQKLSTAALAVRPKSTEEISRIVNLAKAHNLKVVARGGGMSYTLGYAPAEPGTILIDMAHMNRVLEINEDDLYITVECGCTWAQIHEALKVTDFHIPFLGTMSGIQATVGGGLGNNATGLGRGDISDDLLGVEAVLPGGKVITTGALVTGGKPLIRNYGPDFTGLFINDSGAFGIRTKAIFRLSRKPRGVAFASFGFTNEDALIDALTAIARTGVATELMSFETYHHQQFAAEDPPTREVIKDLIHNVLLLSSSKTRGYWELLKAYRPSGINFLLKWPLSLHIITDGFNQVSANQKMKIARSLARQKGGRTIPATITLALRAQPFNPIDRLIIGKDGECSFPSNCSVPLSQGKNLAKNVASFFEKNADLMKAHDLRWTRLMLSVKGLYGCEPIIYWFDRMNPLRFSVLRAERQSSMSNLPDNSEAREVALDLRHRLVNEVFLPLKGAHFQIGKYYPYREALSNTQNYQLLETVKTVLDPDHTMNPGALGL